MINLSNILSHKGDVLRKTIYTITNKKNGMVYVGQAWITFERWKRHKEHLSKGIHCNKMLQKDWNEFGEDGFIFSEVEHVISSQANSMEKEWIKVYAGNGCYNIKGIGGTK